MPIALLKVMFLRTVNNTNGRGPSATAKRQGGISGTETMLLVMHQPYDVTFYAYQPMILHIMLISFGK
jgi:hypothetical protein